MREPYITDEELAEQALRRLLQARDLLKLIGAKRTLARTRLAISSCRGAVRNAGYRKTRKAFDGQS